MVVKAFEIVTDRGSASMNTAPSGLLFRFKSKLFGVCFFILDPFRFFTLRLVSKLMRMERPTYELKSKNEILILFKFLKLVAIFVGVWAGIWFTLVFFTGRRRRTPVSPELFNVFSNVALYGAVGIVLYYIFSKIRNKQVEKMVFDYDLMVIKITYKSYFLHIKSVVRLSFDWIDSTIVSKQSFLYGDHHILSIFFKKKRVAYIGGASSDWQKLPNFLIRIDQRIRDICSERMITKANQHKV